MIPQRWQYGDGRGCITAHTALVGVRGWCFPFVAVKTLSGASPAAYPMDTGNFCGRAVSSSPLPCRAKG